MIRYLALAILWLVLATAGTALAQHQYPTYKGIAVVQAPGESPAYGTATVTEIPCTGMFQFEGAAIEITPAAKVQPTYRLEDLKWTILPDYGILMFEVSEVRYLILLPGVDIAPLSRYSDWPETMVMTWIVRWASGRTTLEISFWRRG